MFAGMARAVKRTVGGEGIKCCERTVLRDGGPYTGGGVRVPVPGASLTLENSRRLTWPVEFCRSVYKADQMMRNKLSIKRKNSFSLIEVLVVIAVIALLAALLLPGLRRAKKTAVRVKCMNNLRQQGLIWHQFANDNEGKMRIDLPGSGKWLWDADITTIDMLVSNYNLTPKICYDPSFEEQNLNPNEQEQAWNYPGGYRVIGYWMMMQRCDSNGVAYAGWPTFLYPGEDQYVYLRMAVPDPTSRVLLADATGSDAGGNFAYWVGGFTHRSPHLEADGKPWGANVCFLDGHVTWKPYGDPNLKSRLNKVPLHYW